MTSGTESQYLRYRTIYAVGTGNTRLGHKYNFPIQYVHLSPDHRAGIYFANNNNPFHEGDISSGDPLYVYNLTLEVLAINRDPINKWAYWGVGWPAAGAALMCLWSGTGKIPRDRPFNIRHFASTPGDGVAVNKGSAPGYCYFTADSNAWASLVALSPAELFRADQPPPALSHEATDS